jgi:hypothetical protein
LVEDLGQVTVEVHGIQLPFRHQVFASGGRLLNVFYCLWPERVSPGETALREDGSQRSRLLAVLAGKRNLGQQVLELVVAGPATNEAALALLRRQLPALITREPDAPHLSARAKDSFVTVTFRKGAPALQGMDK